jgi:DNA-binding beta-propeller fold protein YncE
VSRAFRLWACGLVLALAACGEVFILPPQNLARVSAIVLVTEANPSDASPEYGFVLDTGRAQLVLVNAASPALIDLHPEYPGFNGVLLGGLPAGLAASPDGKMVVVTNWALGTLQVICTPLADGCAVPHLVGEVEVGPNPEGVVMVGSLAYVTRPRDGLVVEVDPVEGRVLGSFDVGGAPRGLGVSRDGARLFVANSSSPVVHRVNLSTRTVLDITTGFPTREIFVSPNPEWVYALRAERGTLLVIDPATETLVNTNPDGPPGAGPDITFPSLATGMAFQTFTEAENLPIGAGQYGFVSTSDGNVYVLNTEGTERHKITDRSPPSRPSVQKTPEFGQGTSVLAVTSATPRLLGYDTETFGITFTDKPRVVRTEAWNVIYEGAIDEAAPSPGTLVPGDILVNRDLSFTDLTVPGTGERVVQDGDLVVLLDTVRPDGTVDCSQMDYDARGRKRRFSLSLSPDRPHELRLSPEIPDTLPPLVHCYDPKLVSYEVRPLRTWAVKGHISGYQGRARECPNTTPDAACRAEYAHQNPFFQLTLKAGTEPSETDMRWSFATSDGVSATVIFTSDSYSAPGLPRAIAGSRRPSRTLVVADEGNETLTFINPGQLSVFSVLR